MFSKFKEWIRKVVNRLLNKDLVAKKLNIDVAVSDNMSNAIDLWSKIYENKSPWLDDDIKSLNLGAAIANEFARLVTVEFESEITGNDFLQEQYSNVLNKLRKYVEYGCAKGGLVFKPYLYGETIAVDYVQADKFLPIAYNTKGEITAAVFVEQKRIGKELYTRLEYHDLKGTTYTIQNLAFCSTSLGSDNAYDLGTEVPLTSVDEWSSLSPLVTINNIKKPLFAYFKVPQANNIDTNSPLGVSVYSRAIDLIKEADKQYSRILWEFEGSELAINASVDCFKLDKEGNPILPKGKERLYRSMEYGVGEFSKVMETFSPTIRDSSLFNGFNNILKRIEFNCNLSYGTISDPQNVDKTAEEIINSKQRMYSSVKDIQNSLEGALNDLIYAMSVIGQLYGLCNGNYEVSYNWDDSIIVNKDKELEIMRNDVIAGIIRPELYIMKEYGVTLQDALKMMPDKTNDREDPDDMEE